MKKIVFRADGNAAIGLGHVIRSLALADMLSDDFHCVFVIKEPSRALAEQIKAVCQEMICLPAQSNNAGLPGELDPYITGDEIIVLDGYSFNTTYQKYLRDKGCAVVCIDDTHEYPFLADMVINHGTIDRYKYQVESYTQLLLGTQYSLLRKPFLQQINKPLLPRTGTEVFLCFGGSDPQNLTCTYIDRLLQFANISCIHVVVGSAFEHHASLKQLLAKYPDAPVQCHQNISATEMVAMLNRCRIAIVPGSTIAIECASTGIPFLCGYYVDNQRDIVQMLGATGLAITVGDFTTLKKNVFYDALQRLLQIEQEALIANSKQFFDGKIKERFTTAFIHLYHSRAISIRKAIPSDVDLYYHWANDPNVRVNAINQTSILYNSHCQWFAKRISATDSYLYVGMWQQKEFGQVRFDYEVGCYNISYSISGEMRGKGLGVALMNAAIGKLKQEVSQPLILRGLVKVVNLASMKIFERLNFDIKEYQTINNEQYILFEKTVGFDS